MTLRWIGKTSLVLGILSFVRIVTEMLFYWGRWDLRDLQALVLFETGVATLWSLTGLCLLSGSPWGLRVAGVATGCAAARTIISVLMLGPGLVQGFWYHREDLDPFQIWSAAGSRLFHYGIELVFWPVVLFTILKASANLRPRDAVLSTGTTFSATGVVAALIQAAILAGLR